MSREKAMASIDIGAQAVQMLLARFHADGRLEPINEYVAMTKLADALPETGALAEDAMQRTIDAAKEMQDIAMKEGATSLVVTACSAIREASNRSKFLLMCHQKLNVYPQLLSGKDEARLNFLGSSLSADPQKPLLAVGIGGSSMQLAFGFKNSISCVSSVPLGSATLERLYSLGANPGAVKQKGASLQIRKEVEPFAAEYFEWVETLQTKPAVLVSGSLPNTLAAIIRKQPIFDFKALDLTPCARDDLFEHFKRVSRMKPKERLSLPGVDSELEPFMASGLFLMHEALAALKVEDFRIAVAGMRAGVLKYFMDSN